MKIFLQVFSETLSVHFCARCEHNVKHNNLSPTWDSAHQWPGARVTGGYWPWDRRCCWRWGPWTRRGSTPSYWPCSSPDTTFIKSSSVDQGQRKSLEIQFTSVQCWFGALDIFIQIISSLLWHHCAAHSPRSAHRRLGGGGAGAQGSYPRPLQCTVCLISRDLGWYQAWPGCSLLTSAQWLSQLQTPGRPQWPAPQLKPGLSLITRVRRLSSARKAEPRTRLWPRTPGPRHRAASCDGAVTSLSSDIKPQRGWPGQPRLDWPGAASPLAELFDQSLISESNQSAARADNGKLPGLLRPPLLAASGLARGSSHSIGAFADISGKYRRLYYYSHVQSTI